ncbi:hypothetical protein [Exiguobacterium chiriqhucha]|uniref:hypothetical protein n=1 Tax=Exiguobacterium chiriqhucha TaxID=1385984 RepID=UPI0023F1CBC1|nr:hypothetical protein [Exiguobacterium chiriqhucha]
MIEASKKKWFNNLFSTFVKERQIRPFFHTIHVRADDVPTPGLFLSTHSSWWDGMILLMLNEYYLRHDVHVLMDEDGLRRFPFFRHLGAFSIKKANCRTCAPRSTMPIGCYSLASPSGCSRKDVSIHRSIARSRSVPVQRC